MVRYLLLLLLLSCAHEIYKKPHDAGIHTLYFEYWKDGQFHPVNGHVSDIFDGGSTRKLRVLIPKDASGILIVTDDGNELLDYTVSGQKWININLANMPYNTKTSTIGLSMVTTNYGTMSGRLYLIGNLAITDPLDVDYRCPYKKDNGAVGSCTRPNKFNFFITVKIKDNYLGKMRISSKGVCENENEFYNLDNSDDIFIKIKNSKKGYCNIRIDTRQKRLNGEWKIKKFKEININYFDGEYIPLSVPEISGGPGDWNIVLNDNYESYFLNGKRYNVKFYTNTIKSKDDKIKLILWDKFGRMVYVRKQ